MVNTGTGIKSIMAIYHIFREEQKEQALVKSLIKPGWTCLDIGANIGNYTKLFSQLVGDRGQVYSFEPTKKIFAELIRNTAYSNVVHLNKAVYYHTGAETLQEFEEGFDAFNSLAIPNTEHKPVKETLIESITLDDFCSQYKVDYVHYLKIDAEGSELKIFEGAQEFLQAKKAKYIQFEISKAFLQGFQIKSRQVFEYLINFKYLSHVINPDGSIGSRVEDTSEYQDNFIAFQKGIK